MQEMFPAISKQFKQLFVAFPHRMHLTMEINYEGKASLPSFILIFTLLCKPLILNTKMLFYTFNDPHKVNGATH